ncbi:MAG: DEAD/DEAH box helicase [Pseudomonadota bacterium]|nr:DEAD/DEAH box helicase [Pseudomonadota bacterium]MEC8294005.1 DEAD/DEAH box helicase [Pseudomonadota bacterium]
MSGAGVLRRPVLKAFARSRQRPVRRQIAPFHRFRLFVDEYLLWHFAPTGERLKPLRQAIAAQTEQMERLNDPDLVRLCRQSLRAEDLLKPGGGAERIAAVLEVIRRETGLRLRTNQIECAVLLLNGDCVELRTGEGKTLSAALAALAAASVGVSTHVVTVNDYLAERDHDLIAPLAARIGLSSAVVLQSDADADKRSAYDCDIVYGTNKTFVFDHLRDKREQHQQGERALLRQTGQALAIVDEVDSVLIDDATVPMILSEPADLPPEVDVVLFRNLIAFARALVPGQERVLDSHGNWRLTKAGIAHLEEVAPQWRHPLARTADVIELAELALTATFGFLEGVAYILREGEVVMVDQATGRLMPDRKWDYGLQQMIEIVAGVEVTAETRTVGHITQQTYFRQYRILSGLTGTAHECRAEFWAIFKLAVKPVAPHAPSRMVNHGLRLFRRADAKWRAVAERAITMAKDRSVLIGVNDVSETNALVAVFQNIGCEVAVLNALSEAQEAELVAQAGQAGRITIATHLAGRGTDIALEEGVRAAGGLHVIIASVMASARLERQLYGRAARQGDPGSYDRMISLEDRGLSEGAFSLLRHSVTWLLRRRILPRFSLAKIHADRDRRARSLRRKTLLREQDMRRRLGYK